MLLEEALKRDHWNSDAGCPESVRNVADEVLLVRRVEAHAANPRLGSMDPLVVIILGGTGGLVVALLLLGRFSPRGAQVPGKPASSSELAAQNEIDDLDQMLAAKNAWRLRKGLSPISLEDYQRRLGGPL